MNRLGIFTGGDLRRQSRDWLQERFGKAGIWYHGISRGVDDRPVIADRPRKSSGSETTYAQDLTTEAEVEGGLRALARSEEHTSELQSLMRISYAVFCLQKKNTD